MRITNVSCSDARKKLLDSAEELFAVHGYELTSIRQIAGAAGMNLSLISYYFGSKQALYREIFKTRLAEITLSLQNIAWYPLPATGKLNRLLTAYADRHRLNGNFQRILYREILFLYKSQIGDVIENYLAENKKVFTMIMAEGAASGDFRPLNSSLFFMTLISVMSSTDNMDEIKTFLYQILLTNNNTMTSMN
jgi:TetR/AcrR family transcriptional regulator